MSKNKLLSVIIDSNADCDESKCLSYGLFLFFKPLLLTCYSNDVRKYTTDLLTLTFTRKLSTPTPTPTPTPTITITITITTTK